MVGLSRFCCAFLTESLEDHVNVVLFILPKTTYNFIQMQMCSLSDLMFGTSGSRCLAFSIYAVKMHEQICL